MCATELYGGSGLAASGIAHHPGDILVHLGVGQHVGGETEVLTLADGPMLEAETYLRRYAAEHVIADAFILGVQNLAHHSRTDTLQALAGAVAAGKVLTVGHQCVADGILVLFG